MFGWFKRSPKPLLASTEEREAILSKQHPLFRVVDAGFHEYIKVLVANPRCDDSQIEDAVRARGVEAGLAEDLVRFAPLAFGREIVQQLGVQCSDRYTLHNLADGTERELPLADELTYAWARAMVGLYRTAERNEVFQLVALRSAELDAVNNALHGGVSTEQLRESTLAPSKVHLRRPVEQLRDTPE
jgi:hypothetical protein